MELSTSVHRPSQKRFQDRDSYFKDVPRPEGGTKFCHLRRA